MSRITYYSPLLLGIVAILLANSEVRRSYATSEPWMQWVIVALFALSAGVSLQLAMVGAQGVFARVLPVPGGRSIRGGAAIAAGWCLLGFVAAANVAGFLAFQSMLTPAIVIGCAAGVALVAFIASYAWCWPTATRDFGGDDVDLVAR